MIAAAVCAAVFPLSHRFLPPDEWHRLKGTELENFARQLSPTETHIIAVEQGDELIACWAVTRIVHFEGLWVAPAHRKRVGVARRLLTAARHTLAAMGANWALTGAATDEVRQMLETFGAQRMPMDTYMMTFPKKESLCPPQPLSR